MIQITPHMRILLAVEPVDFRKGIDGLSGVCKNILDEDPFAGYLFIFTNKKRTSLKILIYDGQGYWLCQKRLSKGKFGWWPKGNDLRVNILDPCQLQHIIWNGNPVPTAQTWKKISN